MTKNELNSEFDIPVKCYSNIFYNFVIYRKPFLLLDAEGKKLGNYFIFSHLNYTIKFENPENLGSAINKERQTIAEPVSNQ